MAKFIEIIVIAIFFTRSLYGEVLDCEYLYYDEDGYNCKMKNTYEEPTEVTSVSGDHRFAKDINDVKTLYIPSSSNTKYIPTNVCAHFVNLTKIDVYSKSLEEINKDIFEGCSKLQLISLRYINSSTLDEDLFSSIPTLTEVSITSSNIQSLPKDLFKNNPLLTSVILNSNKLKTIEIELTTEQKNNIKKFTAYENVCINEGYRSDDFRSPKLNDVIDKIDKNCKENSVTTSPPQEDSEEQRIVTLERKIDEIVSTRRSIGEQIQNAVFKINKELSVIELKNNELGRKVIELNEVIKSNLTQSVDRVKYDYEKLYENINKISEKTRQMDIKIDENLALKEENVELRANINHNKNLMIAVFSIQVVTIAFAVFITIFLIFFNSGD